LAKIQVSGDAITGRTAQAGELHLRMEASGECVLPEGDPPCLALVALKKGQLGRFPVLAFCDFAVA